VQPTDVYRIRDVADPQRSPDGRWVAYSVSRLDSATDRHTRDLWMSTWAGDTTIRLTDTPQSEGTPRWSPDGRYLAFLASRDGQQHTQLWLLDRLGGEAQPLTTVSGAIEEYAWSPDGSRITLIVDDALRSIGIPTELIVYPDQHHGLARPRFQVDRLERYVAWYGKWLGR
jgi:dipeptidyl aminopeptidase/acylaminoacyl peptidase